MCQRSDLVCRRGKSQNLLRRSSQMPPGENDRRITAFSLKKWVLLDVLDRRHDMGRFVADAGNDVGPALRGRALNRVKTFSPPESRPSEDVNHAADRL